MTTLKIPTNESEAVEFKTSFNIETVEPMVAFANAKYGNVLLGVRDNGSEIRRIINYFTEANLTRPDFRNISEGFQVTVYASSNEYLEKIQTILKRSPKGH